jgi:hypothetical protein
MAEISKENEQKILADIERRLGIWDGMASSSVKTIVSLGVLSILSSLFVASFAGSFKPEYDTFVTKTLSFIAAASATILASFDIVARANNSRFAWRHLQKAKLLYQAGIKNIEGLIMASAEAENMLGGISFKGANGQADKPSGPASATNQGEADGQTEAEATAHQADKAVDQANKAADQAGKVANQIKEVAGQASSAADQANNAVDQARKAADQAHKAMGQPDAVAGQTAHAHNQPDGSSAE